MDEDLAEELAGWEQLSDEAFLRIDALLDYWPTLEDVPEGVDRFAQYPVVGSPAQVVDNKPV